MGHSRSHLNQNRPFIQYYDSYQGPIEQQIGQDNKKVKMLHIANYCQMKSMVERCDFLAYKYVVRGPWKIPIRHSWMG